MKIPSFLKSTNTAVPPKETSVTAVVGRQWRKWPSCNYPDTLSFRCSSSSSAAAFDGIFKTLNSIFFHDDQGLLVATEEETEDNPHPDFAANEISFSTDSDSEDDSDMVVRGIRSSDRLFFDPDQISSAILLRKTEESEAEAEAEEEKKAPGTAPPAKGFPFEESVVLAMESEDPYLDFRRSMEEMVEFKGIDCKDWDRLEELLQWYLNVNGEKNHGFIVGAFLDLLVGISGCGPTATTGAGGCDSFSSAVTCLSPSHESSSTTTNSDSSSPLFYRIRG